MSDEIHSGYKRINYAHVTVLLCLSFWCPISFFGASIVVFVNNLKRTVDAVLRFPYKTYDSTQPWHQKDFVVFTVPLNLTKLN